MLGREVTRELVRVAAVGGGAVAPVEGDGVVEDLRARIGHVRQPYAIRSANYRARMERLRPLTESECYTRLYGQRDPTVTIISRQARVNPGPTMTGEELLRAFDVRLDGRDDLASVDAEAA